MKGDPAHRTGAGTSWSLISLPSHSMILLWHCRQKSSPLPNMASLTSQPFYFYCLLCFPSRSLSYSWFHSFLSFHVTPIILPFFPQDPWIPILNFFSRLYNKSLSIESCSFLYCSYFKHLLPLLHWSLHRLPHQLLPVSCSQLISHLTIFLS